MGSWEKFSLSESEGNKFAVQEELGLGDFLLAAKFHTRRALNMEAIAKTFKLLWRTKKGFEIRDMGNHMMLFVFSDAADIDRVLQGEPWTFDKHLVALKKMEKSNAIKELDFSKTSFWVQVHNLPLRSSSLAIAKEIVSIVGQVDMKASEEGDLNSFNFLRLRVAVDTTKPLCRGRKITMAEGKEGWVSFKFERLPIICYWCGMLTHSDRECPVKDKSRGALKAEDQQFGSWLRASTPNPYRRTVIRVAGFDDEELREDEGSHGVGERDGSETAQVGENPRAGHKEGAGDGPVGDVSTVMELALIPGHNKDTSSNSEIIHNGLGILNSDSENNAAYFKAQLEDIDEELARFDQVTVQKSAHAVNLIDRDLDWSQEHNINGPVSLGQEKNYENSTLEKAKPKPRGWVRREQNRREPIGDCSSLLKKRTAKEEDDAGRETEGVQKKLAKACSTLSVEAGSQPRRHQ